MRCFISGKNRLHLWQKNADDSKLPVDLHGNVIGDFSVYWSYKSTQRLAWIRPGVTQFARMGKARSDNVGPADRRRPASSAVHAYRA